MILPEEKIPNVTFSRATIFVVVTIFLFLQNAIIFAAPEVVNSARVPRIERIPHDVVYLVDETTGKRVLALPGNWSPEVIDEFHQFLTRTPEPPETLYTIRQILATGTVEQNLLKLVLQLQIVTTAQPLVRVPLGFSEGVFLVNKDAASFLTYQGNGRAELGVMTDGSYVVLIENSKPPAATNSGNRERRDDVLLHNLTLTLWFPLTTASDLESRCVLTFPRAISSQLELTVPLADAEITCPRDSLLIKRETNAPKQTRFLLQSLKNRVEIAWRPRLQIAPLERPIIIVEKAECAVKLSADKIEYHAKLPIRTRTTPLERCTVRLPAGAVLLEQSLSASDNYKLYPVPETSDLVEVVFAAPVKESRLVTLSATRYFPQLAETSVTETLRGFEVLGAERQAGTLSIAVSDELNVSWTQANNVQRQLLVTTDSAETNSVTAKFAYANFPFAIHAQLQRKQCRIHVKPHHTIQIFRDRAELTSRLVFTISELKTDALQIDFGAWTWKKEQNPSSLIAFDNLVQENQQLTIPLRNPAEGVIELELQAEIKWDALISTTASRIEFSLPLPTAHRVESALVEIFPDDNIKLSPVYAEAASIATWISALTATGENAPSPENSPGLAKQKTTTHIADLLPQPRQLITARHELKRQQESLIYQTSGKHPRFVANAEYLPRQVTIASETVVRPNERDDQKSSTPVTQTIRYNVNFEPLTEITLWVPDSLLNQAPDLLLNKLEPLRITRLGKEETPLAFKAGVDEIRKEGEVTYVKKIVDTAGFGLGNLTLALTYALPPIKVSDKTTLQQAIELIVPADAYPLTQAVLVEAPRGVGITLYGDARQTQVTWRARETAYSAYQQQHFAFVTDTPQFSLPLQLAIIDPTVSGMMVLKRIWLQTWLQENLRTDFLALTVIPNRSSLSLTLPPGVTSERCHVMVDGVVVDATLLRGSEIEIPLGKQSASEKVFVDIRYQITERPELITKLQLPRFAENTLIRSMYWNLVLPAQRHLVDAPRDWTPEYRWQWNGLFWQRVPLIDMSDADFPAEMVRDYRVSLQMNQYLFSSFHPAPAAALMTMNRAVLVLVASALTLLSGLALIYLPQLRYAGSLLFLGLAGTATAFVQPTLALLAMQAAFLGCFLVLVSLYFHRLFLISRPKITSVAADAPTRLTPRPEILEETSVPEPPRELPPAPPAPVAPQSLSPTSSI